MRSLLRRLRRRRTVLVDEAAYRELLDLAVFGAACEIVQAEELRWLSLDPEPS